MIGTHGRVPVFTSSFAARIRRVRRIAEGCPDDCGRDGPTPTRPGPWTCRACSRRSRTRTAAACAPVPAGRGSFEVERCSAH